MSSASRFQVLPVDPQIAWQHVEFDTDLEQRVEQLCAAERTAVCDLAGQPTFRAALITMPGNRHRLVLTIHHIVIDGWSLPILLQEIFTSYYGQRLPAPVGYRSFVSRARRPGPRRRPGDLARGLRGLPNPDTGGPAGAAGRRDVASFRVSEQITRAVTELARSQRTTINTVLQAAWAQLLTSLTGQQDVAFGTAVSGRSVDLPGRTHSSAC